MTKKQIKKFFFVYFVYKILIFQFLKFSSNRIFKILQGTFPESLRSLCQKT